MFGADHRLFRVLFTAAACACFGCSCGAADDRATSGVGRRISANGSLHARAPSPHRLDLFLVVLDHPAAPGAPFTALAVGESPLGDVALNTRGSGEEEPGISLTDGPPYARSFFGIAPAQTGIHELCLETAAHQKLACTELVVPKPGLTGLPKTPSTGIWEIRQDWTADWERLFSVWIAHLFRPLPGQPRGWRPLHQVLHDEQRNFLHNRLGLGEDDPQQPAHVRMVADCGDVPYQLRAYFAWKFGLPFRFQRCSRGNPVRGPRCRFSIDNRLDRFDHVSDPVARFNAFLKKTIAHKAHSGNMRTLPDDPQSDFYPIALSRSAIRPGTVFVDIRSHVLLITRWDRDGLFAIDGHPDKSVTRRRFSPRHFRYFTGRQTGGFKAFRPIEMQKGRVLPVPNRALGRFFSIDQYRFDSSKGFYRTMRNLIGQRQSPSG